MNHPVHPKAANRHDNRISIGSRNTGVMAKIPIRYWSACQHACRYPMMIATRQMLTESRLHGTPVVHRESFNRPETMSRRAILQTMELLLNTSSAITRAIRSGGGQRSNPAVRQ